MGKTRALINLIVAISLILYLNYTFAGYVTKFVTNRVIVKFVNKSHLTYYVVKNQYYNKTHKVARTSFCLKKPVKQDAKTNVVVYLVRYNVPVYIGIEIDLNFCKTTNSNAFGMGNIMRSINVTKCPIPAGCYHGDIDYDSIALPTGFLSGSYMIKTTTYFIDNAKSFVTELWFDLVPSYD